jgi:hypothetical protein
MREELREMRGRPQEEITMRSHSFIIPNFEVTEWVEVEMLQQSQV